MLPLSSSGRVRSAICRVSTKRLSLAGTCAISCMSDPRSHVCASAVDVNTIRSAATALCTPEVIEVEPVVRREAAVVLEARGVAADPGLKLRAALVPADAQLFGEGLEVDRVAPAAEVQAEEQHHRRPEDRREEERPLRKARGRAEEGAAHRLFGPEGAVGEHADDLAALDALAHPQQRI